MGYAWNGVCYQDTASALANFSRDMISGNASGINTFTSAPTISGTGLITWSISNRPLNTTTATTRTGTTQLLACTDMSAEQWPEASFIWLLGLFFAAIAGFKTGFRA